MWATNAAAPGEQLGDRCLAQGSHLSHGIEGGESTGYSLPPPTIPAGPETRTRNLWVTSPTLYPLGHDCPLKGVHSEPCRHVHAFGAFCADSLQAVILTLCCINNKAYSI